MSTSPPAYFLSVTVENVRCFGPAQTLDLSDSHGRPARWTVILGDNGTGKTTLLQAVVSLEPVEAWPVPPTKKVSVSKFEAWPVMRQLWGRRDARLPMGLSAAVSYGALLSDRARGDETRLRVADFQAGGYVRERVGGLVCYAYGASRHMAETGLREEEGVPDTARLFTDYVALPNAEAWLLQADYAASRAAGPEKKRARQRRDQVVDLLIGLLPDVAAIRYAEPEAPRLVPRVEFETPYGWVTLERLGLGYRTMVAWTVDLARRLFERHPARPDPLAAPAVVLVDEIDLHLHPKWQRVILRLLGERFPNTQFIVTAHSPLVVQAAADANLVLLRRAGDHVVVDNDVEAVRNWRVDQILTSDLFGLESARPPHLDELLHARRALLSKGTLTPADRKKLAEVEAKIGALPAGETQEAIEAMDLILRAAGRLKHES